MDVNVIEESKKITHARNLLKKFQSKQSQPQCSPDIMNNSEATKEETIFNLASSYSQYDDNDNSSCSESIGQDGIFHHSPGSLKTTSLILPAGNELEYRCHSVPKNISSMEEAELLKTRQSLNQKNQELAEALFKLQSLHKHYADLHAAYNLMANQKSTNQDTVMPSPAYVEQIHQLRTALASVMDEKNKVQVELRDLRTIIDEKESKQQERQIPSSLHNYEMESKIKKLSMERDHLAETMASQAAQIEAQRKECSTLEAKIFLIQQDRIDTQARIKNLYDDKAQLERNLEQLRNELNMRDIYLRQLARHSGLEKPDIVEDTERKKENNVDGTEESVAGIKKRLKEEIERQKLEFDKQRRQMEISREHFQSLSAEANDRIQRLEKEVDKVNIAKAHLESSNAFLEEQLRVARTNSEIVNNKMVSESEPTHDSHAELVHLNEKICSLKAEREQFLVKIDELNKLMDEKEHELESVRIELTNKEQLIVQLQHNEGVQDEINKDVAVLSVELQNEKTTVSRAIAQNLELKSQLAELQDRLVQVINESAAKEDERISALATIARLRQQIEVMEADEQKHQHHPRDELTPEISEGHLKQVLANQQNKRPIRRKGVKGKGKCLLANQQTERPIRRKGVKGEGDWGCPRRRADFFDPEGVKNGRGWMPRFGWKGQLTRS